MICALHQFGVLFFWFVCVLHVALYVLYVWCASGMCGCDLCVAVFDRLCVVGCLSNECSL